MGIHIYRPLFNAKEKSILEDHLGASAQRRAPKAITLIYHRILVPR